MSRNIQQKIYWLPLALLLLLATLFTAVGVYLHNDERVARMSKALSVSQQVKISLEVFSQERKQALKNLMQNWPTFEPNQVDWFNAQAVTLMGMQRGFSSLAFADSAGIIQWVATADSGVRSRVDNSLIGKPLTSLGLSIPHLSETFDHKLIESPANGHVFLVTGRAISPQEPEHGYVIASFDLDTILVVLLGELVGPQFNFKLYDTTFELFGSGSIVDDGSAVSPEPIEFIGREWQLVMQSRVANLNVGLLIAATGLLMSLLLSWLFHKQLKGAVKLSLSQQRYQTASDAALDALLIYQPDGRGDFTLVEANRVSYTLFKGRSGLMWKAPLSRQLRSLKCPQLFSQVRKVEQKGAPYEQYLAISEHSDRRQWLKVQIVKAAANIAITVRDVTERFQAQQALKQSEERYRRLVDGLNRHFVYTKTADHRFVYVSAGIEKILGTTPEWFCLHESQMVTQLPDTTREIRKLIQQGIKPEPYLVHYKGNRSNIHVLEFSDTPILDTDGSIIAVEGIARDVTTEQALQEEVVFQANHDQLTGLMNRYAFDNQLREFLQEVKNGANTGVMCFVDMDRFKLVNDSCGHPAGDKLLTEIARLFQRHVDESDLLARIGGDEFCIIFRDCTIAQVKLKLDELLHSVSHYRFVYEDKQFFVGASIGVINIEPSSASAAELIKAADNACYKAKYLGRNRYFIYHMSEEQTQVDNTESSVLTLLQCALQDDGFDLYYQPIEPLGDNQTSLLHYEILLRLQGGDGQLVSPALFIPLAERHGLMNKVDWWVVDHTLRALEDCPEHVETLGKVAINLSGITLGDEFLLHRITQRVQASQVPPEKICFEITETTAVTNLNAAKGFIAALRDLGCRFALDDFGAGMSSFTYLKNLDVDYIKIDGSFVRNLVRDPIDHATVKAINSIAHSMGKQTIAEFVVDEQTCDVLRELEVDFGQGYALGKPSPLSRLLASTSCRKLA